MTHIYIMFSDRIPFVNIEIVTLFVKKNQETINSTPSENSSTVNRVEAMNVFVFVYSS